MKWKKGKRKEVIQLKKTKKIEREPESNNLNLSESEIDIKPNPEEYLVIYFYENEVNQH